MRGFCFWCFVMETIKTMIEKHTQETAKAPLTPAQQLNAKIRREIESSPHTHVALINFPSLEVAANLRNYLGDHGTVSVITDTTTTTEAQHHNVVLGEAIPTEDGTLRYHATSEVVLTTHSVSHYHGILMVTLRKVRRNLDKALKASLTWATVQESLDHLDYLDSQDGIAADVNDN